MQYIGNSEEACLALLASRRAIRLAFLQVDWWIPVIFQSDLKVVC
jgi:hypothetical protein